jgi:hypothetical protein
MPYSLQHYSPSLVKPRSHPWLAAGTTLLPSSSGDPPSSSNVWIFI